MPVLTLPPTVRGDVDRAVLKLWPLERRLPGPLENGLLPRDEDIIVKWIMNWKKKETSKKVQNVCENFVKTVFKKKKFHANNFQNDIIYSPFIF
jgi:hypothetical protein